MLVWIFPIDSDEPIEVEIDNDGRLLKACRYQKKGAEILDYFRSREDAITGAKETAISEIAFFEWRLKSIEKC